MATWCHPAPCLWEFARSSATAAGLSFNFLCINRGLENRTTNRHLSAFLLHFLEMPQAGFSRLFHFTLLPRMPEG